MPTDTTEPQSESIPHRDGMVYLGKSWRLSTGWQEEWETQEEHDRRRAESEEWRKAHPPRPDIFKNKWNAWQTPDGFSFHISKDHGLLEVRHTDTKEHVNLKALSIEIACRLEDDVEDAYWRSFQTDMPEPMEEPEDSNALPPIDNADVLIADDAVTVPDEIIAGVLHKSCKAIIGGASKAKKTWILLDLGVSVAAGASFWKWETTPGRVLIINFEIPRAFIKRRIQAVAKAKGIDDLADLDVWTLRGHSAPLWKLLPDIIERTKSEDYALIIIDPVYKLLGGRDENSAGDIGELCNELEKLAVDTGAAVVFGAHYSKGNQANKNAMDRIGGSGVFARDADTIVTLTQHKAENCFTADLILRNHPEQVPFVVEWHFPLMQQAENLDSRDLKQVGGRTADYEAKDLLGVLPEGGFENKEWIQAAEDEHGMSERAFYRLRKELLKTGKVLKSNVNGKWMPVLKP